MSVADSTAGLNVGFGTPFQAQIEYLKNKLNLPTQAWDDIRGAAHDRAFIVAGAAKADLVADLQRAMVQSVTDGTGLQAFRKNFKAIVAKHGWTGWTGEGTPAGEAWRTRIIYQTNMSTSYWAGRYRQMTDPEVLKLHPYWRYIHSDSVLHPRPLHLAWHGLTLLASHPFWKTHFPPNGWGCQCRITSVTRKEGEASARAGMDDIPEGWDQIDPKTGEQLGIDKSFGYAPGASVNTPMQEFIDSKLINLDAPIGAQMWEALKPVMLADKEASFAEWANAIRTTGRTTGEYQVIDAIDSSLIAKMQPLGVTPESAEIVVRDEDVWHTFRDTKSSALPWDWYLGLPSHIQTPRAVILDETVVGEPALLYVFDIPGKDTGKLVLKLNYTVTVKGVDGFKRKKSLNVLRTGSLVDVTSMNQPGYTVLSGAL